MSWENQKREIKAVTDLEALNQLIDDYQEMVIDYREYKKVDLSQLDPWETFEVRKHAKFSEAHKAYCFALQHRLRLLKKAPKWKLARQQLFL